MRIAMFSRYPADVEQPRGGVESATVGLVRGLSAEPDVEMHIITLEKQRDSDAVEKTQFGIVHRLAAGRMPMIIDVFGGAGRRRIDATVRALQPDVVHFQETYGFGGPYADIPTVFTVHGFDSLNLVTEKKYAWWLRAPLWRLAERRGIASHRNLISIAPYVTEKLSEISSAKVTEIPNAISPEFFEIQNAPQPGRVFFAGWINRRKNVASAIRAVHQLRNQGMNVTLHAAGAFADKEYLDEVRALIGELGLSDHIHLLGRIGQDELRKELAEANVFLLPSLQENAPMAIAEAMAAGLPVVTSNVCGMPTMVDEGRAGFLVEPNDFEYTSEKLAQILNDTALRQAMGAFAREKATATYHPSSVISATLDVYNALLGKG